MRDPRLGDVELGRALRDLGAHLAYPPTRDLAPAVLARIRAAQPEPFWRTLLSPRYAFVPALATAALLALATVAFQPAGVRAAEALGLRGLFILRTEQPVPTATPGASATPGGVFQGARRVASVGAASAAVGFEVVAPAVLGEPDEVYVVDERGQVLLAYRPRADLPESAQTGYGAVLGEVRARFEPGLMFKGVGPGTTLEELRIGDERALWISGAPHQVLYYDRDGRIAAETVRLAGNVLAWEHGGLLLRLEADIPRDQAERIAGSVR